MSNQVAETILAQLGGNKFRAMTGARDFVAGERYLQFTLPRGATNKANRVRVHLELNDTYTVTFMKYSPSKLEVKEISLHEMVYGDRLQALFTHETGLAVSL